MVSGQSLDTVLWRQGRPVLSWLFLSTTDTQRSRRERRSRVVLSLAGSPPSEQGDPSHPAWVSSLLPEEGESGQAG